MSKPETEARGGDHIDWDHVEPGQPLPELQECRFETHESAEKLSERPADYADSRSANRHYPADEISELDT